MKNLVSTSWLEENINNVRVLDGTWHMPNLNKDALKEFENNHIENSIFFDLDKFSNQKINLPHMLPTNDDWQKIVSSLGIKNSDHVIIYDNSDVKSSCRVWYNFLYFGHSPQLVSVLDGGLKKWIKEEKKTTKNLISFSRSSYIAKENLKMVLDKNQINLNIKNKMFELIDARNKERFQGLQAEPRKELKSGNIKGSKNLPFQELINNMKERTFKKREELINIFIERQILIDQEMAFTCGSGVTACILGLANSIISGKKPIIYDGSWAEYGLE